jgi:hypothetical protein
MRSCMNKPLIARGLRGQDWPVTHLSRDLPGGGVADVVGVSGDGSSTGSLVTEFKPMPVSQWSVPLSSSSGGRLRLQPGVCHVVQLVAR